MKTTDSIQKALARMLAINWFDEAFEQKRLKSNVALVREYLRRAALWAKALGVVDRWPFFDVAVCIAPEVRADASSVGTLQEALPGRSFTSTMNKTCLWNLHWHNLKSLFADQIANYNLPDPYEPLIVLYERGGHLRTEHGFINVFTAGIPYKHRGWQAYDSSTSVVTLDEKALDKVDATGALS